MPPSQPRPSRAEFAALFSTLFPEKADSDSVIVKINGILPRLKSFHSMTAHQWWGYIYDQLANGRFGDDGFEKLLSAAAEDCPGRPELKTWREPEALPDNRGNASIVKIGIDAQLEPHELAALARKMEEFKAETGRSVRFYFAAAGSENLFFSLQNASDEQTRRFMEHAQAILAEQGINATVTREPYNFRDYYADPLIVEGPDGGRFAMERVRASTRVSDVARSVVNEYGPSFGAAAPGQPGTQHATVSLVADNGTSLRLNPQDTLHDAGVRPGAVLRVHPERTAGAVNPLRREEALARARVQVNTYAAAHPGFQVTANSPVAPTEYVFTFDVPGFSAADGAEAPYRIDHHQVLLYLPPDFPDKAPEAWWQTDIFHPNIDPKSGWVCLGPLQQFYKPSLDFNELCDLLVDIAAYRIYSVERGNYLNEFGVGLGAVAGGAGCHRSSGRAFGGETGRARRSRRAPAPPAKARTMSGYGVELLDAGGAVLAGPNDLLTLATPFVRKLLGRDLPDIRRLLLILPVVSLDNDLSGDMRLTYGSERYGFVQVILCLGERIIYRHPHTVGEVLEDGLRAWLALLPAPADAVGYRLVGPDLVAGRERPTPAVAGVAVVEPYAPGEKPSFRLRSLQPPPPPLRSLADFGAVRVELVAPDEAGWTTQVGVLTDQQVQDQLANRRYSDEVEEGGFLVGHAYQDADRPGSYLASITAAVPAQQTGASLLHFTFTGDSFDHIKRVLEHDYPGQQLLGWYHTHLFAATPSFGLSSIDHRLHLSTFRLPWQVAGLVNVEGARRTLRFYASEGAKVCRCGHHMADLRCS